MSLAISVSLSNDKTRINKIEIKEYSFNKFAVGTLTDFKISPWKPESTTTLIAK